MFEPGGNLGGSPIREADLEMVEFCVAIWRPSGGAECQQKPPKPPPPQKGSLRQEFPNYFLSNSNYVMEVLTDIRIHYLNINHNLRVTYLKCTSILFRL